MPNTIFYKNDDNQLVPLNETLYEKEDNLQLLIEQNPSLLAGEQITPNDPRRWILIAREMGVPDGEDGMLHWSLDHLFLDQDGIPTLVEVKRSTDTRIRREVVGQMLDYAANGTRYWKIDEIQAMFHGDLREELGISPEQAEDYWNVVDNNLKLGKIRMIFAADEIPDQLKIIIEFLNDQMQNSEVLGLEIKQFTSTDGKQLFIPQIIGKTSRAAEVKTKKNSKKWDKQSTLDDVLNASGEELRQLAERILGDMESMGVRIWYGTGIKHSSFIPVFDLDNGTGCQLFSFYQWTNSCLMEIYFQYYKAPYDTLEAKAKLRDRFEQVLGIKIPDNRLNGRPSFPAEKLLDEDTYQAFMAIIKDMITTYRD